MEVSYRSLIAYSYMILIMILEITSQMAKPNIRRRIAAPNFTSKHYYKKKKKHITITRNSTCYLYLYSILSSRKHQSSTEHQFIDLRIYQTQQQSIQHETNNSLTNNTNQPKPLPAPLAQLIFNFLTKVATPLTYLICRSS